MILTVIVLAVQWQGIVRAVWRTWERHEDKGGGAFVHAIAAFVGTTTLAAASVGYSVAPTAVRSLGVITRAGSSFSGSETRMIHIRRLITIHKVRSYCNFQLVARTPAVRRWLMSRARSQNHDHCRHLRSFTAVIVTFLSRANLLAVIVILSWIILITRLIFYKLPRYNVHKSICT